jgi:hypothetical protein
MNLFSIDFTFQELSIIRQSLDGITISGKDAKLIAGLQIKLESEMSDIVKMIEEEEANKKNQLEKITQEVSSKKNKQKSE